MLEQGKKNLEEKEKLFADKTTKRLEQDRQLERKAAELKKWEDRLAERESNVNERAKLLEEKTKVVDRREQNTDRLAEDTRAELHKAFEAKLKLDERKETVIAAEGRHAADEQTLARWQEFLQQKHSNIIALSDTMNQLRTAARTKHIKAVEQLNKDMRIAIESFKSAEGLKETVINMYQRAKSMVEDLRATEASVLRKYEKLLKQIQDEKLNIARLETHGKLLKSTNSSDNRNFDLLLDKVERLSNGLERVGNDMNEQEARFDAFLKKILCPIVLRPIRTSPS